jgi:hypothetical protein
MTIQVLQVIFRVFPHDDAKLRHYFSTYDQLIVHTDLAKAPYASPQIRL